MKHPRRLPKLIALLFLILFLAACGGGQSGGAALPSPDSDGAPDAPPFLPSAGAGVPGGSETFTPPDPADTSGVNAELSPPPVLDGDDFPAQIDIDVAVEGQKQTSKGTLKVSDLGYAIYLLPGFDLTTASGVDFIYYAQEEGSATTSNLFLGIRRIEASVPQPTPASIDGQNYEFKHFELDGFLYEAALGYPTEDAATATPLLNAMLGTIRNQ
jgi:hypothetical protein